MPLESSGNTPDLVSCGLASVRSRASTVRTSGACEKVEPPTTTLSRPRARSAAM